MSTTTTKTKKTSTARSTRAATKKAASAATTSKAIDTVDTEAAKPVKLRKKEMVARVAASSGQKPRIVKAVMDSVLRELGEALANGEQVDIPALGKMQVKRKREAPNATVMVCKLRRRKAGKAVAETADAANEVAEASV